MASKRNRRGKWYARIRVRSGSGWGEKEIPLRTGLKVTALERLSQVNALEADIKDGIDFTFSWLNDNGKTVVKYLTVAEAGNEYIEARRGDGLQESTLRRNMHSLNSLFSVVGKTYPVEKINIDTIENFKAEYQGVHSKQGININLRLIKTFLNWCEAKGYIDKAPKFKPVKVPDAPPSYLTDGEFADIMALDELDSFYKQVFFFYRETGLRLSEPYKGRLEGTWLVIGADATKQKREHEVELSEDLIKIWRLMMFQYDAWVKRNRNPKNFTLKISKIFRWACLKAKVENHKFHDLRHTFAVRMYLITNDIYKVKQLMGHSSVTTTEKYAKFNRRRLASDFPTLQPFLDEEQQRIERPKIGYVDTLFVDTEMISSSV